MKTLSTLFLALITLIIAMNHFLAKFGIGFLEHMQGDILFGIVLFLSVLVLYLLTSGNKKSFNKDYYRNKSLKKGHIVQLNEYKIDIELIEKSLEDKMNNYEQIEKLIIKTKQTNEGLKIKALITVSGCNISYIALANMMEEKMKIVLKQDYGVEDYKLEINYN